MSVIELVGLGVLTGLGAGLLAGLVGIGGGVASLLKADMQRAAR